MRGCVRRWREGQDPFERGCRAGTGRSCRSEAKCVRELVRPLRFALLAHPEGIGTQPIEVDQVPFSTRHRIGRPERHPVSQSLKTASG